MDGKILYKIVNKYKNGIECVVVPHLSLSHHQIDSLRGFTEIIYDTTTGDKQPKIKISNTIYNKFTFFDRYDENEIKRYKFIFNTFSIEPLQETNYNCTNMILI